MVQTLDDLVDQIRQRLNLENDTNITNPEVRRYLNASLAEQYAFIIKCNEYWNISTIDFNLTNADGYILPDDFWQIVRVDRAINSSTNQYFRLHRINLKDENIYNPANFSTYYAGPAGYLTTVNNLSQTKITFLPKNQAIGTYRVLYYPAWKDLEADGYVYIGPPGQHWEEYAILDTCIKICNKNETDPTTFKMDKELMKQRIQAECAIRDVNENEYRPLTNNSWYNQVLGNTGNGWWGNRGGGY